MGLVLFTFSCRKEEVVVDREDNLSDDTALFVYSINYESHNTTDLNFTMNMVMLKGSQSEQEYALFNYYDTSYFQNFDLSFATASSYNQPTVSSYSTILLFDYNETESFKQNYVGYFLRRFFEITDSLPNRNVALSSMSSSQNTPTRLHTENLGNIFGNSWEYNTNTFYSLTSGFNGGSSSTPGLFMKGRVLDLIDSLIASPQATGDLSITVLLGNGGVQFTNYSDLEQIVDYAISNGVKINIITPGSGGEVATLAGATGGFFSNYIFDYNDQPIPEGDEFGNVTIPLQNLDELLKGNVFTHRVNGTATQTGADTWQSGDYVYLTVRYGGYKFETGLKIP